MKNNQRAGVAGLMFMGILLLIFGLAIVYGQSARAGEGKGLEAPDSSFVILGDELSKLGTETMETLQAIARIEAACAGLSQQACAAQFPDACANYTKRFDALNGRLKGLRDRVAAHASSDIEHALLKSAFVFVDEFVEAIRMILVNMRCLEA